MQVRQIWPWIAANHKKATRKPYEKTGAFKLGWKFSTRFAKVSPKVLLLAGLAVSDGIQDDPLDRAERRVFFELHMAQHAKDEHDPGEEAALVKSWSDLIADKQRQPWEIFQAAFSGCSVGQLPGWARKTAASKGAVQLPQVRLLSLFKHFGNCPSRAQSSSSPARTYPRRSAKISACCRHEATRSIKPSIARWSSS